MKEFSKKVIVAIMLAWFVGVIFGIVVVSAELLLIFGTNNTSYVTIHLGELLTFIGAPPTCGIVAYMCKSAFENKEKIKNRPDSCGCEYEYN